MAKKNIKETEQTLKECLAKLVPDNEPLLTEDDFDKLTALNNAVADVLYNRELMDRLAKLDARKVSNPAVDFVAEFKEGLFNNMPDQAYNKLLMYTEKASLFWNSMADISFEPVDVEWLKRDLIHTESVVGSVIRAYNAVLLSSALDAYRTECDNASGDQDSDTVINASDDVCG